MRRGDWIVGNKVRSLRAAAIIALSIVAGPVHAQGRLPGEAADYPSKPIRFVVPSSPGGGADVLARSLAPKLADALGKVIVVENRSGAGGIIGYEIVAKAPADGYTLLIVAGGYTLNPSLYAKLPYDTLRDFERVSLIACAPNLLVVHSSVPVNSVQELIALAKAKPRYLNYASSGVGTTSYLSAEIFKAMTGVDMVHVPYKGAGDSTAAAIAGQVHLIFSTPNALVPQARAGRVRALGVTSARRLPIIPDVPTIAEAGVAGYEVNNCYGILIPAKTPVPIVNKLNREIVRVLRVSDMRSHLENLGFEVLGSTPEQFTAFAKADMAKWAKELQAAGIQPQ
jgi:tripartite-type tricarboxylate transporter receptor subunit TctC